MRDRLYFEKVTSKDDFKYYLKLFFNEKVMKMNFGRVFTTKEAKIVFNGILKNSRKHKEFGDFKVFKREGSTFMGTGAVYINDNLTEVELEYALLPEYWGNRYGSEIVDNLLNIVYKTKSIKKVTAIIKPDNIRSRKILLSNGFASYKVYKIDDGSLAEKFIKEI